MIFTSVTRVTFLAAADENNQAQTTTSVAQPSQEVVDGEKIDVGGAEAIIADSADHADLDDADFDDEDDSNAGSLDDGDDADDADGPADAENETGRSSAAPELTLASLVSGVKIDAHQYAEGDELPVVQSLVRPASALEADGDDNSDWQSASTHRHRHRSKGPDRRDEYLPGFTNEETGGWINPSNIDEFKVTAPKHKPDRPATVKVGKGMEPGCFTKRRLRLI